MSKEKPQEGNHFIEEVMEFAKIRKNTNLNAF